MDDHHLRHDCRLCGSSNLVCVLELTPTPPANNFVDEDHLRPPQTCYPLDLYLCRDCTHVQLCDVVDPRILFEHYVYVSGTSPTYRKHLLAYAQDVITRYLPDPQSEIMEIGSNDGTFLKVFQDAGLPVHGVDPAQNIAAIANADRVPTTATFFGKEAARALKDEGHKPGVILANHVFAHIDDLRGVINGVEVLLRPDGFFIFEVSYLLNVVEKLLFDTIYHEHVAYHSVKALQKFLEGNGFELIEVQDVEHQGGSLRSFAQKRGGPRQVDKSVVEFLAREKRAGLDDPNTYRNYASRLENLKKNLNSLLHKIKAEGKTIAGFGAPAKATTLMYHFGLDQSVIDFIVDDNPIKQGTYTPGLHVPVLPSSALYEQRPDYLVILAWNFADSIMKMHKAYQESGGCFIIPLPELCVIPAQ
jgi:SAM-dependent methyltransferase